LGAVHIISRDELAERCFVDARCVVQAPPGRVLPFGLPAIPPQAWQRLAAIQHGEPERYAYGSLFGRLEPSLAAAAAGDAGMRKVFDDAEER
jgi:hypothetical protein